MFVKNGKNLKKLYTGLSEEQIKKGNFITLICSIVCVLGIIVVALIPQEAAEYMFNKFSWFGSVNVFMMIIPLIISAYCLVCHFKVYKIRDSLTSNELPRGLVGANKTFSGLEIQMILCCALALYEIALVVMHPSILTAVCVIVAIGVAVAAVVVRFTTKKAFSSLSERKPVEEVNEEVEEFYN